MASARMSQPLGADPRPTPHHANDGGGGRIYRDRVPKGRKAWQVIRFRKSNKKGVPPAVPDRRLPPCVGMTSAPAHTLSGHDPDCGRCAPPTRLKMETRHDHAPRRRNRTSEPTCAPPAALHHRPATRRKPSSGSAGVRASKQTKKGRVSLRAVRRDTGPYPLRACPRDSCRSAEARISEKRKRRPLDGRSG
jgi:hypothetical protein